MPDKYYIIFNEDEEYKVATADNKDHAIKTAEVLKGIVFTAVGLVKFFWPVKEKPA